MTIQIPHRYNSKINKICREINGKYNNKTKQWTFSLSELERVNEINWMINDNLIKIIITSNVEISVRMNSVNFVGYVIAKGFPSSGSAWIGDGVEFLSGEVLTRREGSNWETVVAEHSQFRLEISETFLGKYLRRDALWSVEIVGRAVAP